WQAHARLGLLHHALGLADDGARELVRARELYDEVQADLPARHADRYRHAAAHAALAAAVEDATGGAALPRTELERVAGDDGPTRRVPLAGPPTGR
ncbi:MAG TPA: hypothetical protein VHE35_15945, partial [Kofleriaceae bacterium]|nr:hypothetical protein [Kofleriaceae bacterium]